MTQLSMSQKSIISQLESHCRELQASLAALRATPSQKSEPPLPRTPDPALALAPIMEAIQMLSHRLEAVESSSPNGAARLSPQKSRFVQDPPPPDGDGDGLRMVEMEMKKMMRKSSSLCGKGSCR